MSLPAREKIGCRHRHVIAVAGADARDLCFIDAFIAHAQAQSLPVRQIVRCRHRLVIAVTCADAPDLGFHRRSHRPWPGAGTSSTSNSRVQASPRHRSHLRRRARHDFYGRSHRPWASAVTSGTSNHKVQSPPRHRSHLRRRARHWFLSTQSPPMAMRSHLWHVK